MKQEVVPTSPKSQHRMNADSERRTRSSSPLFLTILLSVVVSFGAGMTGFFVTTLIPSDTPVIGGLNLIATLQKERTDIILSTRGNEQSLLQESPSVLSEIAGVYSASPDIEKASNFVGNSVVATTDGWLVIATSLLPQDPSVDVLKEYRVIVGSGESYTIDKRIDDAFSGVSFIHIPAQNLDVATFSSSTTISVGQLLSVIEKQLGSYVVYERRAAGELTRANTIRSTQKLDQYTVIDPQDVATTRSSSPVYGSNADLLGITLQQGVVVPASIIYGGLQSVVLNGELKRPQASFSYINSSRLTDAQRLAYTIAQQGIYMYDVKQDGGSGLQKQDFITAINGVNVTETTDLTTMIHSKPIGTEFIFTVLRGGQTVTVTWKSQ